MYESVSERRHKITPTDLVFPWVDQPGADRQDGQLGPIHYANMFHCHNLTYEDMGQFMVVDDPSDQVQIQSPSDEMKEGDHAVHRN